MTRSSNTGRRNGPRNPGRQAGSRDAPTYAALDLGTNNCRLLIAQAGADGGNDRFRVVDAFSRIVRLGEGVAETGRLSERAIRRTIDALRVCSEKLARYHRVRVRCIATEACRRSSNAAAFIDRVRAETGLDLEVVSTREEAALAVRGCESLLGDDASDAFIFDIGGGSTELIHQRRVAGHSDIAGVFSAPLGVVTFAERHGGNRYSANRYGTMVSEARHQLSAFEEAQRLGPRIADGTIRMIGTSGTVTTLAAIHLKLNRYDRRRVDGCRIGFEDIGAVSDRLAGMNFNERAAIGTIGRQRADLVVPGAAILQAICELWPVGELTVADRGLREGIILGLMEEPPKPLAVAAS